VLLERLGLTDARRTFVRRLSGGQRQRLSLALALIGRPELVFLDEPTAGMDPHARATTRALIGELRDRGVTVVLTTHAIDEAEQLCDRVAIVDHGRVVAAGTPAELTAGVGAVDGVAGALEFRATHALDLPALAAALHIGADSVREVRAGEYVVDAPATPELVADLAVWLRDKGAAMHELRTGRSSLESVFLRLTGEGSA
jgi:ABC-2 type transport system ATP-binding protein